ncbi:hypothetical protein DPMN_134009 [Dreissena polymorpha]|uniref:Uncharacterized protein n=1 Tax=Dreissena polymorpha TaxID=45954 RepID=A0A9D4JFE4_DREPO|nr:hypothetical protein DPMN_134009 [Dreissena polymorpha]
MSIPGLQRGQHSPIGVGNTPCNMKDTEAQSVNMLRGYHPALSHKRTSGQGTDKTSLDYQPALPHKWTSRRVDKSHKWTRLRQINLNSLINGQVDETSLHCLIIRRTSLNYQPALSDKWTSGQDQSALSHKWTSVQADKGLVAPTGPSTVVERLPVTEVYVLPTGLSTVVERLPVTEG